MFQLHFELNDQALSALKLSPFSYPAFSGLAPYVNKRHAACLANAGPVPPGVYYLLDRESGGLLGPLWDVLKTEQNGLRCMRWIKRSTITPAAMKLNAATSDFTPRALLVSARAASY